MPKNEIGALNEAIDKIKKLKNVLAVEYIEQKEKVICGHRVKAVQILKTNEYGECSVVTKSIYINLNDYSYKFGMGGLKVNDIEETKMESKPSE